MPHRFLFYAERLGEDPDRVELSREERHHLVRVLRKAPGDEIWVTDGCGRFFRCRVESHTPGSGILSVEERMEAERKIPEISLALACIKRNRFEQAVEQCTELGVASFIPFKSARSIDLALGGKHRKRLETIAVAAMKQSFGAYLPSIEEAVALDELVEIGRGFDRVLVADRGGGPVGRITLTERVLLVVGPEAGFDADELEMLVSAGFTMTSVAPTRLRSETAAVSLVAALIGASV